MKRFIILFIILIITFCVSAKCEKGQIDINSASLEELQKIMGIGDSYAKQIISLRPFENLNELVKVKGIAEKRLEKIKEENLACIKNIDECLDSDEDSEDEEKNEDIEKNFEKDEELDKGESYCEEEKVEIKTINLNAKDIKSDKNKKKLEKKDYIKYGFVIFCVFLGVLMIFKKRSYKTEFN
jgi:competence ComEA-like helix-hairpin-helix protein